MQDLTPALTQNPWWVLLYFWLTTLSSRAEEIEPSHNGNLRT